uniref:Uncharacterized protein n=1 Tax=Anguilla anguilla TaxID=7936 RepID=A0A0E9RSC1_ANGAN
MSWAVVRLESWARTGFRARPSALQVCLLRITDGYMTNQIQ